MIRFGHLIARTVAVVAIVLGSLFATPPHAAEPAGVVISTGAPMGVYFALGNAICRLIERAAATDSKPLACAAKATGGSLANVESLRTGATDLAIVQSDWIHHAVRGSNRFEGRTLDRLRTLFSLHAEPFQLLVARRLGVRSFTDLRGRKINAGPIGSAQRAAFLELAQQHGLDERAFAQVAALPADEQIQAFCDGDIEALGMMIGYPNVGFGRALRACHGMLIDVDTPPVRAWFAGRPYYAPTTIPKGVYDAQDRDVTTFGVLAVLTATSEMDEETVYRVSRSVFTRLNDLKAMHPALAELDARRMITMGLAAPIHPGAARYYRERGWIK